VHRWATWAEQEVRRWPQVQEVQPNRRALEEYLRLAQDQLRAVDTTEIPNARPTATIGQTSHAGIP
jgi:hypothetical protein